MVDLTQFATADDALDKIDLGERYLRQYKRFIRQGMDLNTLVIFYSSMVSRSVALHSAISREIRQSNPHAVLPMMRAFAEDVLVLIYVIDKPKYVNSLLSRLRDLPEQAPKRKSVQTLLNHAAPVAPGFKMVYSELCEGTHFGTVALWTSHSVVESDDEDSAGTWSWQSAPHWRADKDMLIACAQLLELADAMEAYLEIFGDKFLAAMSEAPDVP